jgi:elongation factor G
MAKYRTQDIRNVAFMGHGGAGKTTLVDTILMQAKAVDKLGSVDDGTSVSDFEDEEKHRKFSIDASILHCDWKGRRLNIIDTPGYPDFIGACLGAMSAVEVAIIVIHAGSGIQVNTRRVFREAGDRRLGRFLVVNKMDVENIDFDGLLASLQETFGKQCVPLNVPVGQGDKFSTVVGVRTPPATAPAGALVDPAEMRSKLVEAAVESDEELMMRYLEGEQLSDEETNGAITKGIATGTLVPILFTSSKKGIGITELLDAIAEFGLAPNQVNRTMQKKEGDAVKDVQLAVKEDGEPIAHVFKTVTDPFVGKLSYLRVHSGKLVGDTGVQIVRTGKPAKFGHLLSVQGKKQEVVAEAIAGDIVAVAKVEELVWGDTVGSGSGGAVFPAVKMPTPMASLAVQPKARGDEQKISGSLAKIADEDPTFRVRRDAETKEMVISGMSDLHLDVVRSRCRRRFQLEMEVKPPRIPYRETITIPAEDMYRHKKQTGGAGQFAEVHLRVHPMPRGGVKPEEFITKEKFPQARHHSYHEDVNFLFIDSIVGGTIPNQYIPSVEKGVRKTVENGVLAGYVVQDVAVEVHFGKDHPVDSKDIAFQIAGEMAFKQAFEKAKPAILEPIVIIEVTLPTEKMGDIMADLSGRRGRIQGTDTLPGNLSLIKASIPLGEVMDYARSLGSITGGQGSYTLEPSHYDVVPGNVQQQIIDRAKKAKEEAHAAH